MAELIMSDVVVFIRGGVFQGAVSNTTKNRIMVVDYDDEDAEGFPSRTFTTISASRDLITRLVNEGTESFNA
jgi:hypothetical protein